MLLSLFGGVIADRVPRYRLILLTQALAMILAVIFGLTFVIPVAFVNWYPALFVLGRDDPFEMPQWLQFASPLAAVVTVSLSLLVWRTGVRHYTSTGS